MVVTINGKNCSVGKKLQQGTCSCVSAEPVFLTVLWEQDQYVLHSLQGAQCRLAKKEESILVQNRGEKRMIGSGTHHRNPLQSLVNSPFFFFLNRLTFRWSLK